MLTQGEMRAARDENGKTVYVEDMTYGEWKEKFITEKGQMAWNVYEKSAKNTTADKKQYENYKTILGKNAPKSIDEFQKLKYTDNIEWEMFKDYTKSLNTGELTALADFELYKNTSAEIDSKLVGITTSNGVTIKGKTKHFIVRVIGSVEQRRSGVSINDVKKALTDENAEVLPVRVSENGNSQRFRYNGVEVSINPQTGGLIQTNPLKRSKK